jgi:hypothetical protein
MDAGFEAIVCDNQKIVVSCLPSSAPGSSSGLTKRFLRLALLDFHALLIARVETEGWRFSTPSLNQLKNLDSRRTDFFAFVAPV